jgi:hypothetical protein
MSLPICTYEWQAQHDKEMVMTNLKSAYLARCGLRRWMLDCVCGLNPSINSIYEVRKYGVEITLHKGCPFGDFDLCVRLLMLECRPSIEPTGCSGSGLNSESSEFCKQDSGRG